MPVPDFNDQPHSATYQLLREGTLNDHAREEILRSSVVHRSIDEARARAQAGIDGDDDAVEEEGDDEADGDTAAAEQAQQKASAAPEADSDHMLKNCRAATADDGLLTLDELTQLHSLEVGKAVSAYGSYFSQLEGESEEGNYFGVSCAAILRCRRLTPVPVACTRTRTLRRRVLRRRPAERTQRSFDRADVDPLQLDLLPHTRLHLASASARRLSVVSSGRLSAAHASDRGAATWRTAQGRLC